MAAGLLDDARYNRVPMALAEELARPDGAPLRLSTVMGSYPHTLPLKARQVTSPRLELDFQDVVPANRAFRPMVNQLAYDVSELALVTYLLARALGRPITSVPVILMQQSAYSMLLCRADSPLRSARDLEGKTIAVRAYTQTTGVWLRGMLADQFGLDLSTIRWLTFEPAHVDGYADPPNAQRAEPGLALIDALQRGAADAAAGLEPDQYPELRSVIPNAAQAEAEWIAASGVRPINHTLVVTQAREQAVPWLRAELARLVGAAKAATAEPSPPDGLDANRAALATLARYAHEQGITPCTAPLEELFPSV
jgi:4,5-dihydroxyphthalate decarboxylase